MTQLFHRQNLLYFAGIKMKLFRRRLQPVAFFLCFLYVTYVMRPSTRQRRFGHLETMLPSLHLQGIGTVLPERNFSEYDINLGPPSHEEICRDLRQHHFFARKKGWRRSCSADSESRLLAHTGENLAGSLLVGKTKERRHMKSYSKLKETLGFVWYDFVEGLDVKFESCKVVVATAIFGAQDDFHQPVGTQKFSGGLVCFIAFIDLVTLERMGLSRKEKCGVWHLVSHPYVDNFSMDPRLASRLPKLLLPSYFPGTFFNIWVDSKLQLRVDILAAIDYFLVQRGASFAVSKNHVRSNVYDEARKLHRMFHTVLSVNDTYDDHRTLLLSKAIEMYKNRGFDGEGLPDAGLLFWKNDAYCEDLSLEWFEEIVKFPYGRDQVALAHSIWTQGRREVNMLDRCEYTFMVNEIGHKMRNGQRSVTPDMQWTRSEPRSR